MGLGAKVNFAFITVILVAVLGQAGYALFVEWRDTNADAQKRLTTAADNLLKDMKQIDETNKNLGVSLLRDPRFLEACAGKNREAIGKIIKEFIDRSGLSGFVAVIDERGNIILNSEAPGKAGDSARSQSAGVDFVLMRNDQYLGPASLPPTSTIALTAMLPLPIGQGATGVLAVCQPINAEFLTGMVTKLELLPEHISGIDIALFSPTDQKIVAFTPGLVNSDGGMLARINQGGDKAIPAGSFASGPQWEPVRLWRPFPLPQPNNTSAGVLLLSTPVPSLIPKAIVIATEVGIGAAVALVLGFIFAAGISGSVSAPLRFLTQRARDLASGKATLPPLDGLPGEWLELGELMDTSVSSMRSSVQSLKQQLTRHNLEVDERLRTAEQASQQLDTVNRQLTEKTRQLAEISKQVNFANQQMVLLQQKLDSVLQISTEGFLILDQFGSVLHANPVILNWMGVSEGEIAGRHCFDLIKKPGEPRDDGVATPGFARHSGNPADLITQFFPEGVVYHRYQDKAVEVLAHLQPVVTEDSNIQGYIMVLRDKSLRSEIAQLRTEIIAMLSDSIRAPLVSVEPTWKNVLSNAPQTMHPSVGQSLAQLHTHYEQLIGLVDSLLMMYGGIIPPPVIPREQVVITRLVADCLEEVANKARDHQLMLDYKTVTGLPPVNVDKETIKRVTVQLLEKMIEITAPGGRVRVETLLKGNEMRMGFYSSGPAASREEIEDMFVGFIQGKHPEETYSSRLSMYLARNNIERIGGRIWAESQESRGTAIFFTIGIG